MNTFVLRPLSLLALTTAALSASAQTSFYGSDFDGNPALGLVPFRDASNSSYATVYDDFTLGETTRVQSVFGNFLSPSSTLYFEIRQGTSAGNGGTLLFSGTLAATSTPKGTTALTGTPYSISKVTGDVSGVTLGAGTYFLGLGLGPIANYLVTTNGANGVGGPLNNDVSYFDASFGPFSFTPAAFGNSVGPTDFSMGLNGVGIASSVPGPVAALPFALIALRRRRRA